jgi:hypothetical protein
MGDIEEVPQWQKDEVISLKKYYNARPGELLSWDDVLKQLKRK